MLSHERRNHQVLNVQFVVETAQTQKIEGQKVGGWLGLGISKGLIGEWIV